ncbi:hypothetical protein [Rasiella sp. SM2506]|uniref:hypothetical protein n=1 Tax=Rasiella sp. SM2506 TaxID=3423914 RepID=UPI003D7AF9BD
MRLLSNNNIFASLLLVSLGIFSLSAQPTVTDTSTITGDELKDMMANEEVLKEWITKVQTPGVIVEGGKMIFSDEAQKLAQDAAYRAEVYKNEYTIADIREPIAKFEIQKAFWRMIHLYPNDKETILKFMYAYDKVVSADKLVTASFYTYAFFDPEITTITDGKPNVHRPDLFEEYLRTTKEIVTYIAALREQENSAK